MTKLFNMDKKLIVQLCDFRLQKDFKSSNNVGLCMAYKDIKEISSLSNKEDELEDPDNGEDESEDPDNGKNFSSYEQMIRKNREANMALLRSIKIEEAKIDLLQAVEKKKGKWTKQPPPAIIRKSRRLKNFDIDLKERGLKVRLEQSDGYQKIMSFKDVLQGNTYWKFQLHTSTKEWRSDAKTYNMTHLKRLTLSESNIAQLSPAEITSLAWHPYAENLIVAAGDKIGNLGIFAVKTQSNLCLMKSHLKGISHLQFNPFRPMQLLSSGYDGILQLADMRQQKFFEIYSISDGTHYTCFDFYASNLFLTVQNDGHITFIDSRYAGGFVKKHVSHDCSITTVNIHPTNRNLFVTADSKGAICIWDLRKLYYMPVVETNYYKQGLHSAYFSPITGNTVLASYADNIVSIFDTSDLRKIKFERCFKLKDEPITLRRATWLPNSEEAFAVGTNDNCPKIKVYDTNFSSYDITHSRLISVTPIIAFHPTSYALAAGGFDGRSGKIYAFT